MKMSEHEYPLISVVILNYNGINYLKKTIPPILELEYHNYEIVVVDNGSNDKSIDFLRNHKRIRLIENKVNFGYSKGKNICVKNARGSYVLLLDDDILINNKNILPDLLDVYNKLQKIGFLSVLLSQEGETDTTLYGGYIKFFGFYNNPKISLYDVNKKGSFKICSPEGGAIFFNKTIFNTLGGYDESQPYYLDVGDLGIRAILNGYDNYSYTKHYFTHLGKIRKDNTEIWCWKYKYNFSGISRIIFKNFEFFNIVKYYPVFVFFMIIKTLKQFLLRRKFCVIKSFFWSIKFFIEGLSNTLERRREIQSNRAIKDDTFLKIQNFISK